MQRKLRDIGADPDICSLPRQSCQQALCVKAVRRRIGSVEEIITYGWQVDAKFLALFEPLADRFPGLDGQRIRLKAEVVAHGNLPIIYEGIFRESLGIIKTI